MSDVFWDTKRVAVTGANGFIGSHIVDALVRYGSKVTAAVYDEKNSKNTPHFVQQSRHIQIMNSNLFQYEACEKLCEGQHIILHFAGLDGGFDYKAAHAQEIYEKNMLMTKNMLRASEQSGVKRFLLMSSIGIYPHDATSPVYEEDARLECFGTLPQGYIRAKQESEILVKEYAKENAMGIAIARLGNVYGPRDDIKNGRVIPTFISLAMQGQQITLAGDGLERKSFLHISDAVPALLELTKCVRNGEAVNIASSEYISIKSLAEMIHEIIKKSVPMHKKMGHPPRAPSVLISTEKAQNLFGFQEKTLLYNGLTALVKSQQTI